MGIAAMKDKGLFIVMAKVKPEQEAAFNTWYDEDHLPKALNRFPGVISGRRYKTLDGGDGYNYMAIYEFESRAKLDESMKSDALKGLIQEFNAAFSGVDRKRITGVEIKSLVAG
jgi:antibiotic biosynthesis monooxygenase (ABM) superfamily enzyme